MKYANRLTRSISAALSVFMALFSIQTSGIRAEDTIIELKDLFRNVYGFVRMNRINGFDDVFKEDIRYGKLYVCNDYSNKGLLSKENAHEYDYNQHDPVLDKP